MQPESPKSRFLKSPLAKAHGELMANPNMQVAMDTALLQMQWTQPPTTTLGDASSIQLRMEGAKIFYDTLMRLADKTPEKPKLPNDNLNTQ